MNRKAEIILSLLLLAVLTLAACAPKATEAPPTPPEPLPTEPPPAGPPPSEPPPLTEAPVELAGPPMEVGSKYTYVDGSLLVAVPAGEFIMGHGGQDNPEHVVFLDDFWIYRAPVTNAQFARCVGLGLCQPPDPTDNPGFVDPYQANKPVVGVNYEQAVSYCESVHARLPTEAEWEKTGRGPDGNLFPWGEEAPSCDWANLSYCVSKTTEVLDYPQGQSFYEALDMAGNTFEWVADWYKFSYYGESPVENPFGPETGQKRSVRSSGFKSDYNQAELARRYNTYPLDHRDDIGFRCVVKDPTFFAPFCEYLTVYGLDANGNPVPGGQGSGDCPVLDITQNPYCGQGNTPITNVQFSSDTSGPPPLNITVGSSCSSVGVNLYECTVAGESLKVCQDCTVTPGGNPTCPPGYNQVGNTCVIDQGYPGECLPGYNFDPATQCCTAEPGAGDSFPLCPVGTNNAGANIGCVNFPTAVTVCKNDSVWLTRCGSSGDACQPPAGGCSLFYTWDQGRCCCFNAAKGGCQ